MDTTVEDKYKFLTTQEGIITKDWAAGSKTPVPSPELTVDSGGIATIKTVNFPPALWKIVDEVVVNAIDHAIVSAGKGKIVNDIRLILAPDGRISIYNNGPGIEVVVHKTASKKLGGEILVPTFIFGHAHQGSNHDPAADSITGGTNGLGAKLTNFFSNTFMVETCDGRKYYAQKWSNHGHTVSDPVVIDIAAPELPQDRRTQHVKITFAPDYSLFGYLAYTADLHATFDELLRARMWYAGAYLGHAVKHPITITYNGSTIRPRSLKDIAAAIFPATTIYTHTIIPEIIKDRTQYHYPWEITVAVTDSTEYQYGFGGIVNGIVVRQGRHYGYITKLITDGVKEFITKAVKDKDATLSSKYITDNIFIFINAQIPLPAWTGQRKDNLDTSAVNFGGYTLPKQFLTKLGGSLREVLVAKMALAKSRAVKGEDYKKVVSAKWAGTRRSAQCSLILAEGDSPAGQVKTAIGNVLNWNEYGVMSTGGVIMNARRECVEVSTSTGLQRIPREKLLKNLFFRGIVSELGLKIGYNYDPKSADFGREMRALRYGSVIICVDQDHDGKGNILGLLLTLFHTLWPGLIRTGFVKWFCTPIVRVYPKGKGKVESFYTIRDFQRFKLTSQHNTPKYYKGIGSHNREETLAMFRDMKDHLYTYVLDDRADTTFETYFGDESDLRKTELAKPTRTLTDAELDEQERTKTIKCSDHLETDTNMYQKDNIERKLDHIIDGQNQAGRKILDGILRAFKQKNQYVVAQLAGAIAKTERYHHAVAGLGIVITGKGFIGTGGKQLPLIRPDSNFGTRGEGGNDAAADRYITAKEHNRLLRALFPPQDYPLLQFIYEEGDRCEPKYFVPIIPLALIESGALPGHGWKMGVWGRNISDVFRAVRHLIGGGASVPPLSPCTYAGTKYEWTGTIREIRGIPYSFGKYSLDGDTIRVVELPLRTWTEPFVRKLEEKMDEGIIVDVKNYSTDYMIDIHVKIAPGAMERIDEMGDGHYANGVEEYLALRAPMHSHLNFYGMNGEVISLKTYEEIVLKWFPVRRDFYARRLHRERILAEIRLEVAINVLRYLGEDTVKRGMKRAEMEELLSSAKYLRVNSGKLQDPGMTPTDELRALITGPCEHPYNYLLSIADYDKSVEGVEKATEEVEKCRAKLAEISAEETVKPFPGANLWLRELDKLEEIIKWGIATEWKYEEYLKYTF